MRYNTISKRKRGQYYYANLANNVKRWTDSGNTVEIKYLIGAK